MIDLQNIDVVYVLLLTVHIILGSICAIHALLYKRDSVVAFGWIAVTLGYPLFGPLLYYIFGINRTNRQARKQHAMPMAEELSEKEKTLYKGTNGDLALIEPYFHGLVHLAHQLSERPMTRGNQIEILHNGEEAYPAMLEAIHNAQHYILLTTYIFETNAQGKAFINALAEANKRGVIVKAIIDGVGEWYSWPRAQKLLRKKGVDAVLFDPPTLIPPSISINLRNHRKLLIVDGELAFAGGMNIGDRHLVKNIKIRSPAVDLQFQFKGDIVQQCETIFCEDWTFVTRKNLVLPKVSAKASTGSSFCRAIEDGPNEYLGKISTLLVNAVSIAQNSIWIMTPYFLPSNELTNALQAAALRGVNVNILLPAKNNLPFVKWAMEHIMPRLLRYGVKIFYQHPPFVHGKLFIVDDYYSIVGSPNLDPRSLRLNFELAIEIYDKTLAQQLIDHCEICLKKSDMITVVKFQTQKLITKIRNGIFWLFSPYL